MILAFSSSLLSISWNSNQSVFEDLEGNIQSVANTAIRNQNVQGPLCDRYPKGISWKSVKETKIIMKYSHFPR